MKILNIKKGGVKLFNLERNFIINNNYYKH